MTTSIYSPGFEEIFCVPIDHPLVADLHCPIDDTPLVSSIEYDHLNYSCLACGAIYDPKKTGPLELQMAAKKHLDIVRQKIEINNTELKELDELKKIITASERTHFIQPPYSPE